MKRLHERQPCRIPTGNPVGWPLFFLLLALAAFAAPAAAQQAEPSGLALAAAIEQVLVDAIARTEKSVVAIASITDEQAMAVPGLRPDSFRFRGDAQSKHPTDPDFIPTEYGTGVVIDRRGLILTQYHVLRGLEHWVTTSDRRTYRAKIVGADPRSDLAVLQINANDLSPITFGDAGTLRKGQIVIALGNPYGIARDGQASASWGIVANLARKAGPLPVSDEEGPSAGKPTLHHFGTLIQTDAKLNLGTSGGALINLRGEMIGLTTAVAATAGYETAAGYAVPIDATFRRVIDTLKEGREVEYGLLGVEPENLHPDELRQGEQGLRVGVVLDGTPAARVGLTPGDIITHVNAVPVYDAAGLVLEVGKLPASTPVELTVRRSRETRKIEVKLAKFPVRGEKIVTNRPAPWRGITVDHPTALPPEIYRQKMSEIDLEGCVAITDVVEGSPAWKAGLRKHQFLTHLGRQRVSDPADFYAATASAAGPVRVRINLPDDQQPWRTVPSD